MGKKIEIKNFGYEVVHKSHQIDRIGGNNIMTMSTSVRRMCMS